ncbi:MAG: HlyC/CorC family transporter [Alphaproteobacteria bacterium]
MPDWVLYTIAAIGVLLLMSAFFSASETALTAASRPRMHQLAKQGNRRAGTVNDLRQRQSRLIGGILVGNNLVNILASSLATSVMIHLFGDAGVAYATLAMTLLVLIFAEVMPKTYALLFPDRLALAVAPILKPVIAILSPAIHAIEAVVNAILRLCGVDPHGSGSDEDLEVELRGAIDLHARADETAAHEGFMLGGVLDLEDVTVEEIMTHRRNLHMVDAALKPAEIVEFVLESPFTRIPMYRSDPDNVIGVLHAKALLREVSKHEGHIDEMDIAAVASRPWFIPESTSCLYQLHAFRRRREHFALVVDEYGALMGVVTLEDILEEIVGEIDDEHDLPVAGLRRQTDGSYIVDGTVTIRDINRELDWNLPDEEATTIAGLVLHEARLIPNVGQSFAFHGFRFDILRRQGNQIMSIRISQRPRDSVEAENDAFD